MASKLTPGRRKGCALCVSVIHVYGLIIGYDMT